MVSVKELVRPFYLRWLYFPLFPSARPSYFEDTWRFPSTPITQLPPEFFAEPSAHPDFLFLPMTDWHTRLQRSQHLATALASLGHRCFYLNPHLGREYRRPYLWSEPPVIAKLSQRIGEVHIHLPREPVYHSRCLEPAEVRRIFAGLSETLSKLRVKSLVQIVSLPVWMPVAQKLREDFGFPILYDCHDRLSGFHNIASGIIAMERELLDTCDLALFSSSNLLDGTLADMPDIASKSVLLRNGVETGHFPPAAPPSPQEPQPIAGYMGALDHWFDVEAVALAAESHPHWRFVLIGRVEHEGVLALRRFSNVEFLGEVPHHQLATHARRFSVGMIPFLRNELTLAANPIKLYEYFSMGLPVVSTDLPEVARYRELVYLATPATFGARLDEALAEPGDLLRQRRMTVGTQESWTARAESLLAALSAVQTTSLSPGLPAI